MSSKASAGMIRERLAQETDPGRRITMIDQVCPPEPQLLDTCIVQNLDWVDRQLELHGGHVHWDDVAEGALRDRFGNNLADDLLDVGTLYKEFEWQSYGYPWVVCTAALEEAGVLAGDKGDRVRDMLDFIIGHQGDILPCSFPGTDTSRWRVGQATARASLTLFPSPECPG